MVQHVKGCGKARGGARRATVYVATEGRRPRERGGGAFMGALLFFGFSPVPPPSSRAQPREWNPPQPSTSPTPKPPRDGFIIPYTVITLPCARAVPPMRGVHAVPEQRRAGQRSGHRAGRESVHPTKHRSRNPPGVSAPPHLEAPRLSACIIYPRRGPARGRSYQRGRLVGLD